MHPVLDRSTELTDQATAHKMRAAVVGQLILNSKGKGPGKVHPPPFSALNSEQNLDGGCWGSAERGFSLGTWGAPLGDSANPGEYT